MNAQARNSREAREMERLAHKITEIVAGQDRERACRALATVIGCLIVADPATRAARILYADLYGMHIRSAVRGGEKLKTGGAQ